jgi:hypothetical protein
MAAKGIMEVISWWKDPDSKCCHFRRLLALVLRIITHLKIHVRFNYAVNGKSIFFQALYATLLHLPPHRSFHCMNAGIEPI